MSRSIVPVDGSRDVLVVDEPTIEARIMYGHKSTERRAVAGAGGTFTWDHSGRIVDEPTQAAIEAALAQPPTIRS